MTKQESLNLAAKHVARGQKIIMALRRQVPVGYVLRKWSVYSGGEIVDDQHLIVVRVSNFEEYVENFPREFGAVIGRPRPNTRWYYEVICE